MAVDLHCPCLCWVVVWHAVANRLQRALHRHQQFAQVGQLVGLGRELFVLGREPRLYRDQFLLSLLFVVEVRLRKLREHVLESGHAIREGRDLLLHVPLALFQLLIISLICFLDLSHDVLEFRGADSRVRRRRVG